MSRAFRTLQACFRAPATWESGLLHHASRERFPGPLSLEGVTCLPEVFTSAEKGFRNKTNPDSSSVKAVIGQDLGTHAPSLDAGRLAGIRNSAGLAGSGVDRHRGALGINRHPVQPFSMLRRRMELADCQPLFSLPKETLPVSNLPSSTIQGPPHRAFYSTVSVFGLHQQLCFNLPHQSPRLGCAAPPCGTTVSRPCGASRFARGIYVDVKDGNIEKGIKKWKAKSREDNFVRVARARSRYWKRAELKRLRATESMLRRREKEFRAKVAYIMMQKQKGF